MANNSPRHREHTAKWKAKNRDKVNACSARWKSKNPARVKNYQADYDLRRHYGITLAEYLSLEKSQNGVCAICHRPPSGKGAGGKLHVDHNHFTNKVRQLLCIGCNRGLGYFEEDILRLEAAVEYLKRHV